MDDRPQSDPSDDDSRAAAENAGREDRLGELRAAVESGLEDIRAGRVVDLEQAFDRIEAMLDELEAAKRSGA